MKNDNVGNRNYSTDVFSEDELQAAQKELESIKNNPTDVFVEGLGLLTAEQYENYKRAERNGLLD